MISTLFSYILHFFTVTYFFFYYLVKGKKEWKEGDENPCEKSPPSCCLHSGTRKTYDEANEQAKPSTTSDTYSPKAKSWFEHVKAIPRRAWHWLRNHTPSVKRTSSTVWNGVKTGSKTVWTGVKRFFSWLFAKPTGSKSIDETAPLTTASTFRPIDQSDIYDGQFEESQAAVLDTASPKPFVKQHSEEDLYEFDQETQQQIIAQEEPPLPTVPPTPPTPPVRASVPKSGIAVLPPNLLLDGHLKESEQYSPPPPPIPETPRTIGSERERAASSFSYRSLQENGQEGTHWTTTTTKRDIVSRIPRPNGEDAQFIFRSYRPKQYVDSESSFMMGRSVYKPMEEAERMRTEINRRSESRSSRMNTPVEPIDSRISTPSFAGTSYYRRDYEETPSAIPTPTANLRLRSRTVEPSAGPSVRELSDRWPPRSNATGPLAVKDNFVEFAPETTVTSCKRVIERKVEDKWIDRDESGNVMQEWGSKSWTGQLDQIQRNGPRTISESKWMHVDPQGRTSFHNVNRQCDGQSVIESVVRNVY
ncbi:hypothetical protein QR680_003318 [Steinernema hermaphroditum]|uniref:Uncharacterized protein n=1 Tax=Steinernema hermaphroditum TaxID=289476 RepID=A0AA39H775_9BILA|nr:hypothetical protein QR680_003318 [Steinernema hermaphroditum]